jgi:hypothetical protein
MQVVISGAKCSGKIIECVPEKEQVKVVVVSPAGEYFMTLNPKTIQPDRQVA